MLGGCRRFDGEKNGTPRYDKKTPLYRRARACPSPCCDREIGPRVTEKTPSFHGTIARDRPSRYAKKTLSFHRTIAGDRPSRYGEKNAALSRNAREGQALALRGKKRCPFTERSRGTGPRATGKNASLLRGPEDIRRNTEQRAEQCPQPNEHIITHD